MPRPTLANLLSSLSMQFDIRSECAQPEKALELWTEVLGDYPIEAVERAIDEAKRRRVYPTIAPAHIVELIDGDDEVYGAAFRELANSAWATVYEYMEHVARLPVDRPVYHEGTGIVSHRVPNVPTKDRLIERIGAMAFDVYKRTDVFCDTAREVVANKKERKWHRRDFIESFVDKLKIRRPRMSELAEYRALQTKRHEAVLQLAENRSAALSAPTEDQDETNETRDMRED